MSEETIGGSPTRPDLMKAAMDPRQAVRARARGRRRELSLDERIARRRVPEIAWASRARRTVTVHEGQLQSAMDKARAGDVLALVGRDHGRLRVRTEWGIGHAPLWAPPPGAQGVVSIVNGNADGTRPLVDGISIEHMIAGAELHLVGLDLRPHEYWHQEKRQWESGASIVGSFTSIPFAVLREKDCRYLRPEKSTGYGGQGVKWPHRLYCMGYTLEDCATEDGLIVGEHSGMYGDNPPLAQFKRCHFGSAGRTQTQQGTRLDYRVPPKWLGVTYEDCHFRDAFCGSATASSLTLYGYHGPVLILNQQIDNPGHEGLAPAGGIVAFQTYNYGGNEIDEDGCVHDDILIVDSKVNIGAGNLDAVTIEATRKLIVQNLDTSGSAPGAGWVNVPGLWATLGALDIDLYGHLPMLRSHTGEPGQKFWHEYTQAELQELLIKTA